MAVKKLSSNASTKRSVHERRMLPRFTVWRLRDMRRKRAPMSVATSVSCKARAMEMYTGEARVLALEGSGCAAAALSTCRQLQSLGSAWREGCAGRRWER